ncbi:MAG: hypothetical protein ACYCW6_12635 [Candidatus Xenobia bacterium]
MTALTLTTVNGTQLLGCTGPKDGVSALIASLTVSGGNQVTGSGQQDFNLSGEFGAAFTTSDGNLFYMSADSLSNLNSTLVTVTNGNVDPLPNPHSVAINGAGQNVVADANGHVFVATGATTNNVQAFTVAADGSITANGTSGSTVGVAGAQGIALDPSGALSFLYVSNPGINTSNISVFPLTGGQLGTPVPLTLGNSVSQLATFKASLP